MERLNYYRLGASMYTPATYCYQESTGENNELANYMNKNNIAKSIVICTEDAVTDGDLPIALDNISKALPLLKETPTLRFIRPRNEAVLEALLAMDGIDNIDGFVLPKFDLDNAERYREILKVKPNLCVMPTIETRIAFNCDRLEELRKIMDTFSNKILCIRIGGNDLLNLLGIKRPKRLTIYETAIKSAIDNCISVFRLADYRLSSPVYEYIDQHMFGVLREELERDIAYGFYAKTAIHPDQVELIQSTYRVCPKDVEIARQILESDKAVFKSQGQMCEPATHIAWAKETLKKSTALNIESSD